MTSYIFQSKYFPYLNDKEKYAEEQKQKCAELKLISDC